MILQQITEEIANEYWYEIDYIETDKFFKNSGFDGRKRFAISHFKNNSKFLYVEIYYYLKDSEILFLNKILNSEIMWQVTICDYFDKNEKEYLIRSMNLHCWGESGKVVNANVFFNNRDFGTLYEDGQIIRELDNSLIINFLEQVNIYIKKI